MNLHPNTDTDTWSTKHIQIMYIVLHVLVHTHTEFNQDRQKHQHCIYLVIKIKKYIKLVCYHGNEFSELNLSIFIKQG